MKPILLYIRGVPGSGKNTVGRAVAERLDYSYLWFHDCYKYTKPDPVAIARRVLPMLAMYLGKGKSLVFTRPSRLRSTVEGSAVLAEHCGYDFRVVRLNASRATLEARVRERTRHEWRVSDSTGLDEYLRGGGPEPYPGEHEVLNDGLTIEQAATAVIKAAGL